MATAATGVLATSHGPPLQLLTRLHHLTSLRRSLPHCIAMDLLDDASHECVKRSMTSRPCLGHAGVQESSRAIFVGSCSRLAQPALPTRCPRRGWHTAGGASQRGAASNFERSTHEAAVRGRRRGRGLVVLRRATATECAGARQAGRRDQCRQRECVCERLVFEGLSPSPGWAFNPLRTHSKSFPDDLRCRSRPQLPLGCRCSAWPEPLQAHRPRPGGTPTGRTSTVSSAQVVGAA